MLLEIFLKLQEMQIIEIKKKKKKRLRKSFPFNSEKEINPIKQQNNQTTI